MNPTHAKTMMTKQPKHTKTHRTWIPPKKHQKTTVKTIGQDEYGMPTINGKRVLSFRILPKEKKD